MIMKENEMGEVTDGDLSNIAITPELVVMDMRASSDQEAIEILAGKLIRTGYVKEGYVQAVKDREKAFCTGLALGEACIALPHTDAIHVNREAVAIGVLRQPVTFGEMGTQDDKVNVQLMFMLAIRKSECQIDFLGEMIDALQAPGRLNSIKNAASPVEVVRLFKQYLKM
jgi:PTS system galactitol-specific IIA component